MANKYLVALLVACLVVAANADDNLKARQEECYNYCYNACVWPAKFCRWWCGGRCENPIGMDSLVQGKRPGRFPVPTEEDYHRYTESNPEAPSKH